MYPATALFSGPDRPCSSVATRFRPFCVSRVVAWLVRFGTLIWATIAFVILSVSACWMGGWLISGVTLAIYRLVSETWFAVHTPSTEMGASRQPMTISRV